MRMLIEKVGAQDRHSTPPSGVTHASVVGGWGPGGGYRTGGRPSAVAVALGALVDHPLRPGLRNADALALQRVPQRQHHVAAHRGDAGAGIADPERQRGIRPPTLRTPAGGRPAAAAGGSTRSTALCRLDRHAPHLVRVEIVGDAELHVDAHQRVGERPVLHPLRDEVLVGDRVLTAVAGDGARRRSGRTATRRPPERLAERDRVARLDRLVNEQDDDTITKFETTFCSPKPTPTPTAPEKTVSAVRSMPRVPRAPPRPRTISSAILTSLPISTLRLGVRSEKPRSRLSRKLLAADGGPDRQHQQHRSPSGSAAA